MSAFIKFLSKFHFIRLLLEEEKETKIVREDWTSQRKLIAEQENKEAEKVLRNENVS